MRNAVDMVIITNVCCLHWEREDCGVDSSNSWSDVVR